MTLSDQQRTSRSDVFPSPEDGEIVEQNPPALVWLQHEDGAEYRVIVQDGTGEAVFEEATSDNFAIINRVLDEGTYRWNVYSGAEERGWQEFIIGPDAIPFVVPPASDLLQQVTSERPGHIFSDGDISDILARRSDDIATLERTIELAFEDGMPEPPDFHHRGDDWNLAYRVYFGRHRDFCDRNLVACALGHRLLRESNAELAQKACDHARKLLLDICGWNPAGPCSQLDGWGDEIGLSHSRCLPAVFDWMYDVLSDEERKYVARTVEQYALQCEERIDVTNFCAHPGNSHVGRIPAYLGEAALVLKGTHVSDDTCERWLQKALDIYGSLFPFYGGRDGGWAEGVFYASSYTKWYLPFFLALENVSGFSFLNRPFYQKVSQFFMHCAPPGWEMHPFADGYWCLPDDEEWPGFMAQNPFRVYAERFGPDTAREFDKQLSKDLDYFRLHLLDVFIPESESAETTLTGSMEQSRVFRDAGIVSMHSDLASPESDIAVLARASRYGAGSHQHADQGSFSIIAGGVCLIGPSGYFGAGYGTEHHMNWTNQSKAHNCVLINGEGQPHSHESVGQIVEMTDDGNSAIAQLDLSLAYPTAKSVSREIRFTRPGRVEVTDQVELNETETVSFLLHSLSEPVQNDDGTVTISRKGQSCRVTVASDAGEGEYTMTDQFDPPVNAGIPDEFQVDMPAQYHMAWTFPAATSHRILCHIDVETT